MKRPRTRTALAPRGLRSAGGVSPSGFTLADYVTPEAYGTTAARPSFLNARRASANPCVLCPAECCRARVVMNVCDLVRLCVPLQVPPPAVCALEPCETRNGAPILVGDQPRHITLRKDASGFCSLLIKGFGFVRCGVHALRPAICRIYPFSFERGATRYQMGMIGCPTLWLVDEPRRNAVLDDVESHEHDRVLDRKVVRRWNRLPREERTEAWFWVWALAQAGAEMGVDVSPFLEPKPRSRLKPALW